MNEPFRQAVIRRLARVVLGVVAILATVDDRALAGPGGELTLQVIDRDTKQPLACRMHLTNAANKALKAPKVPYWHDHFVFSGEIVLKLPKGEYAFEIERGPEYLVRTGRFTMDDLSKDVKVVDLKRFVDMSAEGWWSADLDVQRPGADLELLMQADDLHLAELITWPDHKALLPRGTLPKQPLVQFGANSYYHLAAGRDARLGGTLLLFNLPQPLDLGPLKPEFPPLASTIEKGRSAGDVWIDVAKATSWDLPILVALGQVDSIELANSSQVRKATGKSEAPGKPRDKLRYPEPHGAGRFNQEIYYHLLNCGLRIPPTAGSGSGDAANPVGYNRVYVHVDGELTYEKWWKALSEGKALVTNGPLIRPHVEGELPGHVFRGYDGDELELEIGLSLSTRDRISYLEIIKNGQLEQTVRLDDWAAKEGRLPPIKFKESGWFLVRAVTDVPHTYRFATTAPYYVELGDRARVSRESAEFFLSWLRERTGNLKVDDAQQRESVLAAHRKAEAYWQAVVDSANAP